VCLSAALSLAACGGGPEEVKYYYYVPGDFLVSNLAGESFRLFKLSFVMEMIEGEDRAERDEYLATHESQIRDEALKIMRRVTEPELRTDENIQERLRGEIVAKLKEIGFEDLNTIYFNDFVLQ
jgi:flagellar basal body-associated protein FliL